MSALSTPPRRKRHYVVSTPTPNRKRLILGSLQNRRVHVKWTTNEKKFISEFTERSGGPENTNWKECASKLNLDYGGKRTAAACQNVYNRTSNKNLSHDVGTQTDISIGPRDGFSLGSESVPKEPSMSLLRDLLEISSPPDDSFPESLLDRSVDTTGQRDHKYTQYPGIRADLVSSYGRI